MGIEQVLSWFGVGELLANPVFVAYLIVTGVNALLFIGTLAISAVAFRSAALAHYSRSDTEAHLKTARGLAAEVRSLTAQVEKATNRALTAPTAMPQVEQAALSSEPEGVLDAIESVRAEIAAETEAAVGEEHGAEAPEISATERTLKEATKAATVPNALLRLRRHR